MRRQILPCLPTVISLAVLGLTAPAFATTKGLNQIVTPDVQPFGSLSISLQQQDPNIANRYEVQAELGLTNRFEVAVFQSYSPPEQVANAEYAILQNSPKQPYLLSVGFFNWTTQGSAPQPYIEGGYYKGNTELMLGAARVVTEQMDVAGLVQNNHQYQAILGVGYRVHPRLLLQLDYQSGEANSTTAGFTYNISPQLQFNPAVYVSNATGHKVWGYAVLTWNIDMFAPRAQPAEAVAPPATASPPAGGSQEKTPAAQ